jgi:hypothetical protein
LPLFNQAKLTGVLYLENNLTPHAFTPDRTVVLKVLRRKRLSPWRIRDCIAISKIRRLVDANILAIAKARTCRPAFKSGSSSTKITRLGTLGHRCVVTANHR